MVIDDLDVLDLKQRGGAHEPDPGPLPQLQGSARLGQPGFAVT